MKLIIRDKSILIIGHDTLFNDHLKNSLTEAKTKFEEYASGIDALDAIPKIRPDLILCHFNTEDMDGYEIFQTLMNDRSFQQFEQVPFVLFSNESERAKHHEDLFKLGLRGWYLKPIGPHEVFEIILNQFPDVSLTF